MSSPIALLDTFGRPLRNLRLSVTDRCNLRCAYCMPEEDYVWLPRADILSFEELDRLVEVFIQAGIDKVRLTGGEPLLRQDLDELVRRLAAKKALRDLALTTNGLLLEGQAEGLKAAGLHRVTVSLDTLHEDRFQALTRRSGLEQVMAGIRSVHRLKWPGFKMDAVIMKGVNDDELVPLLEFAAAFDAEMRFIEYMDVGGATHWSMDKVVSRNEMLDHLTKFYGPIIPEATDPAAPAERFRLPDGRTFGIIASTTTPFCRTCDRSRVTADGMWYLCLYARNGRDLRTLLRSSTEDAAIIEFIRMIWEGRADRGAEERLGISERRPLLDSADLKTKPHLEMHTRGG